MDESDRHSNVFAGTMSKQSMLGRKSITKKLYSTGKSDSNIKLRDVDCVVEEYDEESKQASGSVGDADATRVGRLTRNAKVNDYV